MKENTKVSFNRNEQQEPLEIEDAKKKSNKGFVKEGARPPRQTSNPQKVGERNLQKAPATREVDQSQGSEKLGKGVKSKPSPFKGPWEKTNKAKEKQETNRPSPKAIKRGK